MLAAAICIALNPPLLANLPLKQQVQTQPRFQRQYPLPGLTGVMMDAELQKVGFALPAARANQVQARILWIDCTANISRYNTEEKIVSLMAQVKDAGFNTVVFDVKPISGEVPFPSKFAPKLLGWRGNTLPADFDPLGIMLREAKKNGLVFNVSLNAFSEGHALLKVGPGYERPGEQTVLYEPQPRVAIGPSSLAMSPAINGSLNATFLTPFNVQSKIPLPASGQFAITVSKDGSIVDGFKDGGVQDQVPVVPSGGCVIMGIGESAAWLIDHAVPGLRISIDVDPLFVPISERPEQQYPLMMNPNDHRVRKRALDILGELLTNYPIDGVIYDDRLRYAGHNADFSEIARTTFESKVGKMLKWPDDIFKYHYNFNLERGISPGPYYQQWLNWRAETMKDFIDSARAVVRNIRPTVQFGIYAGSWFGEYSNFGSNFSSPDFEAGFWYLTPRYRKSGFAPALDFLITGCYYPTATIFDAMRSASDIGRTIEYAGYLTTQIARDATWPIAGISLNQFKNNPTGLEDAIQAACGSTVGVMVFDLSHAIEPFWPVFKQAFMKPMRSPQSDTKLLQTVRTRRSVAEKAGLKSPAVILAAGQPGAGH